MDEKKVRNYIGLVRKTLDLIEAQLNGDSNVELQTQSKPKELESPAYKLMGQPDWPEAVPSHLINSNDNSDSKFINRAKSLVGYIFDIALRNLRVLDYGCDAGWIADEMSNQGALEVYGYDIAVNERWKFGKAQFTDNPNDLPPKYFDVILMNDVIDHCSDPKAVMAHVAKLLKPDGTVYLRSHPWTSRHGSHLYNIGLNKAYVHLYLTPSEILQNTNSTPMYTRKTLDPLADHRHFFEEFKIVKEIELGHGVEPFFQSNQMKEMLMKSTGVAKKDLEKLLLIMGKDFIDYKLKLK